MTTKNDQATGKNGKRVWSKPGIVASVPVKKTQGGFIKKPAIEAAVYYPS